MDTTVYPVDVGVEGTSGRVGSATSGSVTAGGELCNQLGEWAYGKRRVEDDLPG